MIIPEKLNKGDTIGIIAPSNPIIDENVEEVEKAKEIIQKLGYKVKYSRNFFDNTNGYSTKWATVYPYNSSDSNTNNYSIYSGKKSITYGFGDAVLETSTTGSGSTSWNGDYSCFPSTSTPFFERAVYYGASSGAGVFAFVNGVGDPWLDHGFRSVLVAQ